MKHTGQPVEITQRQRLIEAHLLLQRRERIGARRGSEHDGGRIARQQAHDDIDDEGNGKQRDDEA